MINGLHEKMAILVLSYDGCSDLWNPFFENFFKNWADCPYKVYLQTNELDFLHSKVNVLQSGKRESWADSVRKTLDKIEEEFVLVFLEDYFLLKKVDTKKVDDALEFVYKNNVDSLKLKAHPKGKIKTKESKMYNEIAYNQPYCITFGFSILKKCFFKSLCKENYSPWEYENLNTRDAHNTKRMPGKVVSVRKNMLPCYLEGMLVKQKWTRKAYRFAKKNKLDIDTKTHEVMTIKETIKLNIRYFLFAITPSFIKRKIKQKQLK